MVHLTKVHSLTVAAITGRRTEEAPPEHWDDVLGSFDGYRLAAREALVKPPETSLWSPFPRGEITIADWVRRMAHEAAIHRLDAESALAPDPATRFSPEFASDGADEFLTFLTPARAPASTADGLVRIATSDTGRSWTVRLTIGEFPEVTPQAEGTPDVTLEGAADDVYRALWGRPHGATVTGSSGLLAPLAAP